MQSPKRQRLTAPRAEKKHWSLPEHLGFPVISAEVFANTVGACDALSAKEHIREKPLDSESSDHTKDFIQPLFGPIAVQACRASCSRIGETEGRMPCAQSCRYLTLANYGRRITLYKKINAQADASEILNRCTRKEIGDWPAAGTIPRRAQMRLLLERLAAAGKNEQATSFDAMQHSYDELTRQARKLTMPPEPKEKELDFAKDLLRASCLRANLSLTAAALANSKRAGDEYSASFYGALFEALAPKTRALEESVLSQPQAKDLLAAEGSSSNG